MKNLLRKKIQHINQYIYTGVPMLFEKLSSWLKGRFVCKKCGKVFHIMSLGFGEAICPECFDGEEEFIHFDENYMDKYFLSLLVQGYFHKVVFLIYLIK